jgi:hypothetical protein
MLGTRDECTTGEYKDVYTVRMAQLWEAVGSFLLMLLTCNTAGRPAGLLEAEIASERG